jgi:hypothetical protein
MTIFTQLRNTIGQIGLPAAVTTPITKYFNTHPNWLKVALVVNHLFRTLGMTAFMVMLPFTMPINMGICFAATLFYRLTVEPNCAYKFALPSFAGASALIIGKNAITQMISRVAFQSFSAFGATCLGFLPIALYTAYIVLVVNHEVDTKPCCKNKL